MIPWYLLFNFSVYLWSTVVTAISLVLIFVIGRFDDRLYRLLLCLICFSLLTFICDLVSGFEIFLTENPSLVLVGVAECITYLFASLCPCVYGFYLYEYLSRKITLSVKPFVALLVLCIITLLLIVFELTSDLIIQPDSQTYDFKLWPFFHMQILHFAASIVCGYAIIKNIKHLKKHEWIPLLLYAFAPLVASVIQIAVTEIWISPLFSSTILFTILVVVQMNMKKRIEEQEKRLEESRLSIMLSQIQPHFLYNILNVIDDLCRDNPEAHKAITLFAAYLRGNLDSLSLKDPIPFVDELDHVKHYLELEKMRLEDRLDYSFETPVTDFTLPTLSVQPLVENAVTHGIKRKGHGTVTISTSETDDHYQIFIDDDGAGFNPSGPTLNNARSHTGIENVRSRLEILSEGSLCVESIPGTGTRATIEIPKTDPQLEFERE